MAGVFNAVGSVPFTFRDLAAAIGDLTGTPTASVPLAMAEQQMGPAVRALTSRDRALHEESGVAVRVTCMPWSKFASHGAAHCLSFPRRL